MTTRRLLIYCDGGFGNRFNAVVSGLALAQALDLSPQIVWPVNNWCGAAFGELFEHDPGSDPPVVERELASFVAERERLRCLIVEDRLGLAHPAPWQPAQSPLLMPNLDAVRAHIGACGSSSGSGGNGNRGEPDVFYYTALIPPCLDAPAVAAQIRALRFRPEIVARAGAFLERSGLQSSSPDGFFGVQIRKTDFGANAADDDNLFALIAQCPQRRFFVCSDDKGVEARFAALPNVAIHAKTAHVEKRVDGGWTALTADHSGRIYPCNVERSRQSVVDALVDLLVLSHSQIVKTSNSTFLNTALLLRQVCGR